MSGVAIRDRVVELRRVRAGDLTPNAQNWRTHPQGQRSAVRAAIAEIGYADALLVRETPDGLQLIDGHLRRELTPDQVVPVLVLDLSAEEADKLLVTLDPLAALAGTDLPKLEGLLQELNFMLPELREVPLSVLEEARPAPGPAEQDEVPEPPETPETQAGDLYLLGEHRLLCGDATDPDEVKKAFGGLEPWLMVTDPPYGVEYDPAWRQAAGLGEAVQSGLVANDDRASWLEAWRLFPGDVAYVWHGSLHSATVLADLEAAGFAARSQIIWRKQQFAISRGHYHWGHEPCWYAVRDGKTARWSGDRSQSTIWDVDNLLRASPEGKTGHGTQKPVECMARPIRNHGGPDDIVYDPFAGSGTTLVAAEQLGRRSVSVEIDPRYCDVIAQRWERLTGKAAERRRP